MKHSTTVPVNALPSAEKYAGNGPAYQRRFHVMAKPTGSACNLDCSYCFYLHKEHSAGALRPRAGLARGT